MIWLIDEQMIGRPAREAKEAEHQAWVDRTRADLRGDDLGPS